MNSADAGGCSMEKVGPGNLAECGIGCLSGKSHPGYQAKVEWLEKRFAEGLRLLLYRDAEGNRFRSILKNELADA